jgi:hypothetical protein
MPKTSRQGTSGCSSRNLVREPARGPADDLEPAQHRALQNLVFLEALPVTSLNVPPDALNRVQDVGKALGV